MSEALAFGHYIRVKISAVLVIVRGGLEQQINLTIAPQIARAQPTPPSEFDKRLLAAGGRR
ncbi:hypothetical protein E2C01_048806 [Portunus trituberculatus]|uniref:Uncharacterized protein n=1 Tax=Portunus trituberculatus TaxID=210409 RepID=A0A5B7GC64_PORTR|nr:hypothetical protein [Portunus trituberculatus]